MPWSAGGCQRTGDSEQQDVVQSPLQPGKQNSEPNVVFNGLTTSRVNVTDEKHALAHDSLHNDKTDWLLEIGFSPDAAPGGSGKCSPRRAGARMPSGFGCRKLLEKVTVGKYPGDGRERQAARAYSP